MPAAWAAAILSLAVCIAPALGLCSAAPGAPSPCSVEMVVQKPFIEVHVNATLPATASTAVNYTVDMPPVSERAIVSFQGSVDAGWPISISPQTLQISGNVGRTGQFYVTVVVPAGQVASTGTVTLTATMTAAGFQCDPDQVDEPKVAVLPYVDEVSAAASEPSVSVEGWGKARSVSISFAAKANADVSLSIAFDAPSEVIVDGPTRQFALRRDNGWANATFSVSLRSTAGHPGSFPVTVRIVADAGGDSAVESRTTVSFEVSEQAVPGPGTAGALVLLAAAGALARRGGIRKGH